MEAAKCVRDEQNRSTDVRSLFLQSGSQDRRAMSFKAEMLVPGTGQDDLGQNAEAAITFLQYVLELEYRHGDQGVADERLAIVKEELGYINVTDARKRLRFGRSKAWLKSVVRGRRASPFLSTEGKGQDRKIKLHQEGRQGKARPYLAANLPRTVLSSTNAVESPTALLARREMQSWRLLQLEPSALRNSDPFNAPVHVGVDGSHLASTLHHLARREGGNGNCEAKAEAVYARVANRLADLVEDIHEIRVDEDRQRELFILRVLDRHRNLHAARALSDGTLRFLALAVLQMDPEAQGLLCFEEPENGIHPERVSAMLALLQDLCVDTQEEVGPDNPLRQVIVNTHSPAVVGQVHDDDLLVAQPYQMDIDGGPCRVVRYRWLPETWRHTAFPDVEPVSRGALGAYLNPLAFAEPSEEPRAGGSKSKARKPKLVKDREDLQKLLPFPE